jgi:hypothetical protein
MIEVLPFTFDSIWGSLFWSDRAFPSVIPELPNSCNSCNSCPDVRI